MQLSLTTTALALILSASTAMADPISASSIKEVFGITVGGKFDLPDCAYSTPDYSCAYSRYVSREVSGEAYIPVYIPPKSLPKHVNPQSIRLFTVNGAVVNIRYSIVGKTFTDGQDVRRYLVRKYGKDFQKEETATTYKMQWIYPETTITVDARVPENGGDLATVEISSRH